MTDLSKVDFGALAKKFKASVHKNTDLEVSKAVIRAQLEKLIPLNKARGFQATAQGGDRENAQLPSTPLEQSAQSSATPQRPPPSPPPRVPSLWCLRLFCSRSDEAEGGTGMRVS